MRACHCLIPAAKRSASESETVSDSSCCGPAESSLFCPDAKDGIVPALPGKLPVALENLENGRLWNTAMSLRTELYWTIDCLEQAKFEAEKRKRLTEMRVSAVVASLGHQYAGPSPVTRMGGSFTSGKLKSAEKMKEQRVMKRIGSVLRPCARLPSTGKRRSSGPGALKPGWLPNAIHQQGGA